MQRLIDRFFAWVDRILPQNPIPRPPLNGPIVPPEPPLPIVPPPMPTPSKYPLKIVTWAKLIAAGEGATSLSNNPGNLKLTNLTATWGAMRGRPATDGGWLARFSTYEQGFDALCELLVLAAQDQLIYYHKISPAGKPQPEVRTLEGFTRVYAGGPPQGYINRIVAGMGGDPRVDIATFLE